MGEMVEFFGGDDKTDGYLATPAEGAGPGVMVIQEWWGLVPQLKGVCDELAKEGFTALAPDLYHGEYAEHTEMDKAGELMTKLPPDRAARDMGAAHRLPVGAPRRARRLGGRRRVLHGGHAELDHRRPAG